MALLGGEVAPNRLGSLLYSVALVVDWSTGRQSRKSDQQVADAEQSKAARRIGVALIQQIGGSVIEKW
jgi:hypothetical protein